MRDAKTLLRTRQMADMFEVDLKTIHNWVDEKGMPAGRTPGRHLRFKAADVIEYCQRKGVHVPPALHDHAANDAGASS